MALQAQRRFAHAQKISVRRTVRRVASHAVFRDWWVLVSKGAAILCVTTQTQLIGIGCSQIVSTWASVRVVAIGATHFSFAQRVMVRQTHLAAFRLVAPQAGIVRLPTRLHHYLGFRNHVLDVFGVAQTHQVQARLAFRFAILAIGVCLMAIRAADTIRRMRSRDPIPNVRIAGVATQTDAIGIIRGTLLEGDDLGDISPS